MAHSIRQLGQRRRVMMAETRLEEFHACRRLETKAVHDDNERAAIGLFGQVEVHDGEWVGLVEFEKSCVITRPNVEPVIYRAAFPSMQRFRDKARVTKCTHEHEVRNRFPPKIDDEQRPWVLEPPGRRILIRSNDRIPLRPMCIRPTYPLRRLPPVSATEQQHRVMQFPYALVLAVALQIVCRGCVDVPKAEPSLFEAARETTRPTAVHPEDTSDSGHSIANQTDLRCQTANRRPTTEAAIIWADAVIIVTVA